MDETALRRTAGAALLAAAAALLAAAALSATGRLPFGGPIRFERSAVAPQTLPEAAQFAFKPEAVTRFSLADGEAEIGFLQVRYRDGAGGTRVALLHPPATTAGEDAFGSRWSWWLDTAAAVRKHMPPDARVVAWWDNGQRVHLLTGRAPLADAPPVDIFIEGERKFWREVAGAAPQADAAALRRVARWLTMPAEQALREIREAISGPVFLIVCTDDLARAEEIGRAAGVAVPVDSKVFSTAENLHGTIQSVRRWAQEAGSEGYLVQPLPGQRVRAWRMKDPAFAQTLLAQTLPFSSSLYRPLPGARLVYQSAGGSYLSVYQIDGATTQSAGDAPKARQRSS